MSLAPAYISNLWFTLSMDVGCNVLSRSVPAFREWVTVIFAFLALIVIHYFLVGSRSIAEHDS